VGCWPTRLAAKLGKISLLSRNKIKLRAIDTSLGKGAAAAVACFKHYSRYLDCQAPQLPIKIGNRIGKQFSKLSFWWLAISDVFGAQ